jgi:hypothetical protein
VVIYFFFAGFFAVFSDSLKSFFVGAPFAPAFFIFSPLPAAILFFFAWMLAYNPFFAIGLTSFYVFYLLDCESVFSS